MDWTCFGAAMTGAGAYFVCDMVWHWLLITGRRRPARWESSRYYDQRRRAGLLDEKSPP